MAAIHEVGVVAFRANLGPSNIFQLHDAIAGVLENYAFKLLWI